MKHRWQLQVEKQSHKQGSFKDKATLANGGDWSQDVYTIAHNGVFVFKMQFNPIITTYTCLPVWCQLHQQGNQWLLATVYADRNKVMNFY